MQLHEPHSDIEPGAFDRTGLDSINGCLGDLDTVFRQLIGDVLLAHVESKEAFDQALRVIHAPSIYAPVVMSIRPRL